MARRRLSVESLERRLLLAGDVTASVKGGWLVVTGDDLGNQVQIEDLGGGTYDVVGLEDTTIIGAGPFAGPKGIKVDLKGGDDTLVMSGDPVFGVPGDLSIKMGDGDDTVLLENAEIAGKTTVDLGKGAGDVTIFAVDFGKDVAVKSGDAPGVEDPWVEIGIELANVTGNLSVTTGKTNDDIWLDGVAVTKNVTIKTGDGEDYAGVAGWSEDMEEWDAPSFLHGGEGEDEVGVAEAEVPSLIEGKLSIDIGKGGGWLWLGESTVKGDVTFKAGDAPVWEDDWSNGVDVWDATVEGKLTVSLGKGDAGVWFGQAVVNKDVKITTNNGHDVINFAPEFPDEEIAGEGEGVANNFFGGKVTVNSGTGFDEVVMASSEVLGALSINTGDGEDAVALWQVMAGSTVSVKTGNHSDLIGIAELQAAGNTTVDSGNAGAGFSDEVLLTNSDFDQNLSVKTGNGDDLVGIGDSEEVDAALDDLLAEFGWDEFGIVADAVEVWGKLTVGTGSGFDLLSIGWCDIAGSAAVDTGSDGDLCEILDSTVGAGASVKMGAGDDGLEIGGTDTTGKVTLDGGAGFDVLNDLGGNTFTQEPVVKGFP